MASKLVKNATAPTPAATTAMLPTTAAWKRRSHASAAWTPASTMLGSGAGWGLALMAGLLSAVAARPVGRAARIVMRHRLPLQLGTVAAVGVVGFGQLPPAGVVAKQPRQIRVALADIPLLVDPLQVVALGLLGVDLERRADLPPAVALLAGLPHGLPLPAAHEVDHLVVGAQRLQRSRSLGPFRVPLEPCEGLLVVLLAGLVQGQAHGLGRRPGVPGLQRLGERVLGQLLLGCLPRVGVGGVVLGLLSAHGRPPFHSCSGRVGVVAAGTAQRQAADACGRRPAGCGSARRGRRAAAGGPARAPARHAWSRR